VPKGLRASREHRLENVKIAGEFHKGFTGDKTLAEYGEPQ
jgi:hypothetical protein